MTLTQQEEKRLRQLIARNRTNPSFPKPEDFDTTEEDMDDYLYMLNPHRDQMQEQKKHLTIMGILMVVPIGTLSICLKQEAALFIGMAVGLLLCVGYHFLVKSMARRKVHALEESGVKTYIEAVLAADPERSLNTKDE